jgi:xanthine dehydrogenase small subunit
LLEDLYLDYMQQARAADEVIISVWVPKPTPAQLFRTWKVCKRFDSDISAVCAAFCIQIEQDIIQTAKVAFGGMAATSKRARQCEAALIGQPWTEATAKAAMQILTQDYQPLSDMRASASYRMQVAQNLLYRFYLETRSQNPSARWQTRAFTQLEVRS